MTFKNFPPSFKKKSLSIIYMQTRTQNDIQVQKEENVKKEKKGFFRRNKRKIGKAVGIFFSFSSMVASAIVAVHLALPAIGLIGIGSVLSLIIQAIIQTAPAKFLEARALLANLMPDASETEVTETIEMLTQQSRSVISARSGMPSEPYTEQVVGTPSEDLNRVEGSIYQNKKTGAYKAVLKPEKINGKY